MGCFGFTLLELLVVVGLIAALAAFLLGGLTGGGKAAALSSGQATIVNLVTAARMQAAATGRKTRLLVNVEPGTPERFLRFIVWQKARQAGASPTDWDTLETVSLPPGCHVVPASLTLVAGLVENATDWKRPSNAAEDLNSDLFTGQMLVIALEGDAAAQTWTGVAFTPQGTLATLAGGLPPNGAWLLASGAPRAPGSYAAGESPVRLHSPHIIRGVMLSAYGVPALLNDREAL